MLVHYRACGATGEHWLCAKLLSMAVSIDPVVYVHSCRLLRTQHYCSFSDGRRPPLACQSDLTILSPPTHPYPYTWNLWYYRDCKKLRISKTSSEYCTTGLGNTSNKSALLIQQTLCGYNVAQETTATSIFQNCSYLSNYKMWQLGRFL